jgi:hypothetical protein
MERANSKAVTLDGVLYWIGGYGRLGWTWDGRVYRFVPK